MGIYPSIVQQNACMDKQATGEVLKAVNTYQPDRHFTFRLQ